MSGLGPAGRVLYCVLAAAGCAVVIAACGSSSKSGSDKASASVGVQFANCMRSHGVPSFPDSNGGGIHIPAGSGIDPTSPSFRGAMSACRKLLPGGGPPTHASAQQDERLVQESACMRAHGISDFPDPTHTPPSSLAGYSSIVNYGGIILAIPSTINEQSPAFIQAARACNFNA